MSKQPNKYDGFRPHRKYAINVLGRLVGSQLRKHDNHPPRVIKIIDALARRPLSKSKNTLSPEHWNTVDALYKATKLWHGTGRYQYKNGQPVDILQYVTTHGALQPQLDSWDFAGPMTTISLAPARMYARAYADMHGKGATEPNRYGSSFFWAALFVGDMKFEGLIEGKAWTPKGLRAGRKHIAKNSDTWYRKISSKKLSTMEAFYYGSDIPDNYPIIFGLTGNAIEQAPTTRTVAIHEVRASSRLPLNTEVTYIEVPREKVSETEQYFNAAGYPLPVLAIEDYETYASGKPLSELFANHWEKQNILLVDPKEILRSLTED